MAEGDFLLQLGVDLDKLRTDLAEAKRMVTEAMGATQGGGGAGSRSNAGLSGMTAELREQQRLAREANKMYADIGRTNEKNASQQATADARALRDLQAQTAAAVKLDKQKQKALNEQATLESRNAEQSLRDLQAQTRAQVSLENQRRNTLQNMTKSQADQYLKPGEAQTMAFKPSPFGQWVKDFQRHMGQWAAYTILVEGAYTAIRAITTELGEMNKKSAEFQVQGVLFKEYQRGAANIGVKTDNSGSNELMKESIKLASLYGDEVNDVAQDISLWYKRVGDLNAATAMTNEALKFQLATGTQIEDLYKTLTALSSQAAQIPMNQGDKQGFNLSQTPELLQKITAASATLGAGLHQLDKVGTEMGGHTSNAAILLLDALDKDTAALGTLHYSMNDIIAINAAMIQSFGNSGQAASEAGEKIGRIVGGLTGLANKPQEIKKLADQGVNLKGVFDTTGDVLDKLTKIWDHLSVAERGSLSLSVAGTRQYEALQAVIEGYNHVNEARASITKNAGEEDRLAAEMSGTFQVELKKLNAEWEGFLVIVGTAVLPLLSSLVNYIYNSIIPALGAMGAQLQNTIKESALGLQRLSLDAGMTADTVKLVNPLNWTPKGVKTDREDYDAKKKQLNEIIYLQGRVHAAGVEDTRLLHTTVTTPRYNSQAARMAGVPTSTSSINAYTATHPSSAFGSLVNTPNVNLNSMADYQEAMKMWKNIVYGGNHNVPPGGSMLMPDAAKKGKGDKPLRDYTVEGDAIKKVEDQYANMLNVYDQVIKKEDGMIAAETRHISLFGITDQALKQQTTNYQIKNAALNDSNKTTQSEIDTLLKSRNALLAHAGVHAQNTKEYHGFSTQVDSLDAKIRQLRDTMATHTGEIIRNKEAMYDLNAQYGSQHLDDYLKTAADKWKADKAIEGKHTLASELSSSQAMTSDLPGVLSGLDKQVADVKARAHGGPLDRQAQADIRKAADAYDSYSNDVVTANEKIKESFQSAADSIASNTAGARDSGLAAMMKMAFGDSAKDKADATYITEMLKLQKDSLDAVKQYHSEMDKIGDSADPAIQSLRSQETNWFNVKNAALTAEAAAAAYERRVTGIKDSPLFKASEKAASDAVTDVGAAVSDKILGTDRQNQILANLNKQVTLIENQKKAYEDIYALNKNHTASENIAHDYRIKQYDAEIKKAQDLAKAEQDKIAHPNLLKKMAADFVKTFVDETLKALSGQALAKLFKIGPDEAMKKAIKDYTDSNTSQLVPSMKSYGDSTQTLFSSMNTFTAGVQQFQMGVQQLQTSTQGGGGIPGVSGGNFGGTAPSLFATLFGLGAASAPTGGGDNSPTSMYSVGGFNAAYDTQKFAGAGKGFSLSNAQGAIAGGTMAYAGYKQGGFAGGLEAGIGAYTTLTKLGVPSPIAIPAAAAFALFSAFSHHDDPSRMPDKYDTKQFGQNIADLLGSGTNGRAIENANGSAFSIDPTIAKATGNTGLLSYIESWLAKNQNSADAGTKALVDQLLPQFGTTGGGNLTTDPRNIGNISVTGGSLSGDYISVHNAALQAADSIQQLAAAAKTMNNNLVALNQYGSNVGFFPYSWDTPGYAAPAIPGNQSAGQNTTPATPGTPGTPGGGGHQGPVDANGDPIMRGGGNPRGGRYAASAYSYNSNATSPAPIQVNQTITVPLDGRTIARSTQSYVLRAGAQGYNRIT